MRMKTHRPRLAGSGAIALLLLLSIAAGACRKSPQARRYQERPSGQPAASTPAPAPAAETPLRIAWTTPPGWQEEKGGGIRLASFSVPAEAGASGLCTLVPLSGEAGGRRANVERWMQQLGLAVPGDSEMEAFLAGQQEIRSDGGWPARVVDLVPAAEKAGLQTAMMAAIVTTGADSLFVKFIGPPALLRAQRAAFLSLCTSLKPGVAP